MKKLLFMFLFLLFPFCLSVTGYCFTNQKQSDITSCSVVKPLPKYITVYSGLEPYNEISILAKSDMIMKCHIMDEKEVCITKKQASKTMKKTYKQLYTVKVLNVLKADKTDTSIAENKVLKIFSDSCSHNWHDGTIRIKCKQNAILFLKKSSSDIRKYGQYVINAPDWSVAIENQSRYAYDKSFHSLSNISESSSRRIGYGGGMVIQYESSKFEDCLLDRIISNTIENTAVPKAAINKPMNLNAIETKEIKLIKIVWRDQYVYLTDSDDKDHFIQIMKNLADAESTSSSIHSYFTDFSQAYIYYNNYDYEMFTIMENSIIHVKLDKNQAFIAAGNYISKGNTFREILNSYFQ